MTKTVEIYFDDLKSEAQEHLLMTWNTTKDDGNWDTVPLAVIERRLKSHKPVVHDFPNAPFSFQNIKIKSTDTSVFPEYKLLQRKSRLSKDNSPETLDFLDKND